MSNRLSIKSHYRLGNRLPQKVAIVRSLPGLGDMLCCVPALRALRAALPQSQIILIGLPGTRNFVGRFSHYLDEWLEFPGYFGIPEVPLSPSRLASFLFHIQHCELDLVLQMHGNGTYINHFIRELGAKQCAGFYPSGHNCPDRDRFLIYPEDEPEIWRHLRLLAFLGIPLQGDHLEFPLLKADREDFKTLAAKHSLIQGNYICIHPGASDQSRRWPSQYFAAVGDILAAQGWQIVLTGTATEIDLTRLVAQKMSFPSLDLSGQTSLGAMAVLLKEARLLICNDTGVSHLAAALQTNSIVIFFNSDPQRWAPLDRLRHRTVVGSVSHLPLPAEVFTVTEDLLQTEVVYVS